MRKLLIPIVLILIVGLYSSVYVIEEGTRGVVLRFNKIIGLSQPGLHFKMPLVDSIKIIDAKIQTTNSSNNNNEKRFFNVHKKELIVDYFVQWKIVDFNRYYETIAGGNDVNDLILARLNGRLRSEIGKLSNRDIINDTNADTKSRNSLMASVKDALNGSPQDVEENLPIDKLVNDAKKDPENSKASLRSFGVVVIDVRIKQINFPAEVSGSIYANMRAERDIIAREKRYEGVKKAEEIRAKATFEKTKIISEAERQARSIRGEGDANAAKLYAEAFGKDIEFFSFIRSLKAYEQSFTGNDVMVISPDSEFFQYMKLKSNK
ncbi:MULTISPECIES: protease modulator HflC [unclassified Gilliamella]|uniref:protease modulator HflC n=1 Tax=unclassified Gilliamella TaxID=2685620 RepID=UPI00080DB163|nr:MULTISPECIES: protease modulator HflC [Gilliamella]MCX8583658.1 protease modulator HflC [Gilliamella sp. B3372]MCX8586330.1 protease modulator HflC [Gilliamella sp. B3562]MCX8595133.1 protease modulator HflC [Gilliamella sp. B3367]MCX8597373.1 protease modulator HflC [Gilliamella sp. B3493]MCX8599844.1 protease modulator HflC [Gilliamella sp. B3486]